MEINEDDAAIIFKADGSTQLALPKQDPKDRVKPNSILAGTILFLLKEDPSFREIVYRQIDKWVNDHPVLDLSAKPNHCPMCGAKLEFITTTSMDLIKKAYMAGFKNAAEMYSALGWDDIYWDEAKEGWEEFNTQIQAGSLREMISRQIRAAEYTLHTQKEVKRWKNTQAL